MTANEKLSMLKSLLNISGNDLDTSLNTYLDFSKQEIISWRYGYSSYPDIAKATDSASVPIKVYASVFIAKLTPTSGTSYVFTYSEDNESWQYLSSNVELVEYGIGYDDEYDTPKNAETITVVYNENPLVQFDTIQVMACIVGYGLSGAENQVSHSENGINRSFKYSDMVQFIHAHVLHYVGIL